jgi:hypothetical protein
MMIRGKFQVCAGVRACMCATREDGKTMMEAASMGYICMPALSRDIQGRVPWRGVCMPQCNGTGLTTHGWHLTGSRGFGLFRPGFEGGVQPHQPIGTEEDMF